MTTICKLLGMSKSWYYETRSTQASRLEYEQTIIAHVRDIRKEFPHYGVRPLWKQLARDEVFIGRDKLSKLLFRHNMLLSQQKKKVKTSIAGSYQGEMNNLVKDMEVTKVNQVLYTDITYIISTEGILYLSAIMDAYSRKIVSYSINDNLRTDGSLDCLQKAIKKIGVPDGLIHHSDRGSQYTSHRYLKQLVDHNIQPSFTGVGRCYDNPFIERFFRTIKHEFGLSQIIKDKKIAMKLIHSAIDSYNKRRLHSALNYQTPDEVYYG